MIQRRYLSCLFVALLFLGGCAWSVGGETNKTSGSPTLGEELEDLEEAREKGLIDGHEYEAARRRLLDGAGQRG